MTYPKVLIAGPHGGVVKHYGDLGVPDGVSGIGLHGLTLMMNILKPDGLGERAKERRRD